MLVLTFETLCVLAPTYLKDCLLPYSSTHSLWSSSEAQVLASGLFVHLNLVMPGFTIHGYLGSFLQALSSAKLKSSMDFYVCSSDYFGNWKDIPAYLTLDLGYAFLSSPLKITDFYFDSRHGSL